MKCFCLIKMCTSLRSILKKGGTCMLIQNDNNIWKLLITAQRHSCIRHLLKVILVILLEKNIPFIWETLREYIVGSLEHLSLCSFLLPKQLTKGVSTVISEGPRPTEHQRWVLTELPCECSRYLAFVTTELSRWFETFQYSHWLKSTFPLWTLFSS